jgi:putative transposase
MPLGIPMPDMDWPAPLRDESLSWHILWVSDEHFQVYEVRKIWSPLRRESGVVACCTVARLMRLLGLQGVVRGKPAKTMISDKAARCPLDRVNRQFIMWPSPSTYFPGVSLARRCPIPSTLTSCWMRWSKLCRHRPVNQRGLIHPSDCGAQYVSIRYTERLAEAGIARSVGRVGNSYDNALAKTLNGLYKAEVLHRQSWKHREAVELATMTWLAWFNHRRLLEPIANIPPAKAEAVYYRRLTGFARQRGSHQRAFGNENVSLRFRLNHRIMSTMRIISGPSKLFAVHDARRSMLKAMCESVDMAPQLIDGASYRRGR